MEKHIICKRKKKTVELIFLFYYNLIIRHITHIMRFNKFDKKFAPKFCNHWEYYFKYSFISSIVENKHNNKCTLCLGILLNKINESITDKKTFKKKEFRKLLIIYILVKTILTCSFMNQMLICSVFIWFLSISALYGFHIQPNFIPEIYESFMCEQTQSELLLFFFYCSFLCSKQKKKFDDHHFQKVPPTKW